jgi:hypothetical protein
MKFILRLGIGELFGRGIKRVDLGVASEWDTVMGNVRVYHFLPAEHALNAYKDILER